MKRTTFLSAVALAAFAAALPAAADTPPPTGLVASAVTTSGVTLSWTAPSTSETVTGTSNAVDYALAPSGTNAIPAPDPPARFFRLKATEQ